MADDLHARIAQLEAEVAALREREATLTHEVEHLRPALAEALEQQTATAEILRVIATSVTDPQRVLEKIAASALELCGASGTAVWRVDDEQLRYVVSTGMLVGRDQIEGTAPLSRDYVAGRACIERKIIHCHDLLTDDRFPRGRAFAENTGHRTTLAVPMLRQDDVIGVLMAGHSEVRPFTTDQIRLLETFADQAVIAIENARVFEELKQRNQALNEALSQQTATAEILRIIAASPTDLATVLDTIVASAVRLGDAGYSTIWRVDGDVLRCVAFCQTDDASFDPQVGRTLPITRNTMTGRTVLDGHVIHIADVDTDENRREFPESVPYTRTGPMTRLHVPLLRDGVGIGILGVSRLEVRPFTEAQIALLEAFADQAVIAIENARLFQELQDRVGELQALGEVGQALSSTLDLEKVLTTIVANATRLAGADGGVVYEYDQAEGVFEVRAADRMTDDLADVLHAARFHVGEGAVGHAAAARTPIQVEEVAVSDVLTPEVRDRLLAQGLHSVLAVPLLREDRILGGLVMSRRTPGSSHPRSWRCSRLSRPNRPWPSTTPDCTAPSKWHRRTRAPSWRT